MTAAASNASGSEPARLESRLAEALVRNVVTSIPVGLVNAAVLALILAGSAPILAVAGWFATVAAIAVLRYGLCRAALKRDRPPDDRDVRGVLFASIPGGVLWGATPFLLSPDAAPHAFQAIIFMVAGMTAGASAGFAAAPRIATGFNAAALGALGVHYLLAGGVANAAMLVILGVYFFTTRKLTQRAHKSLVEALNNEASAIRQADQIANQSLAFKALADHYRSAGDRAATAEQALMKANTELSLVFNRTPALMWITDDANTILKINAAAAAALGRSPRDCVGRNAEDVFGESAIGGPARNLEVLAAGSPALGETETVSPRSGSQTRVVVDRIPFTDPDARRRQLFVCALPIPSAEVGIAPAAVRAAG